MRVPGLGFDAGPGRACTFVLLGSLILTACGARHSANVSNNARLAAHLCAAHLSDVGAGATLASAAAETASVTASAIRADGASPAPWDRVDPNDIIAECQYRFRPGPSNPVVRCGPDLVQQSTEPTKLYFYDRAGRHSIVHLRPSPGTTTQCSGRAQPTTTTT
jgi:hypothetical protein